MSGVYGADVSMPMSVDAWACLKNERSVSFGIVRCYESVGQIDSNAAASVNNGQVAELAYVDVYHFPCLNVDAQKQVQQAVGALQNANATFRTYWFDVESGAGWSSTDTQGNSEFLAALISAAYGLGLSRVGIYTSSGQWPTIIGDTSGSTYPLWYAAYENPASPNFDDFVPFGGWTTPHMKQFAGNESHAGVCYDGNWMPQ